MTSFTPPTNPAAQEALEARYALRVAARLSEGADALAPDVAERLRFAREQALQRAAASRAAAPAAVAAPATTIVGIDRAGRATLGTGPSSWWLPLASVLPLLALLAGLLLIERFHANAQISAAAEIDAALLADDLPPKAYSDAGFLEFLKSPKD